jgi:hypothetical protein
MENLTLDEIRELKMAVNALIAQRITYSISVKEGSEREKDNQRYLNMDYQLLEKVLKEIEIRKEELEQ